MSKFARLSNANYNFDYLVSDKDKLQNKYQEKSLHFIKKGFVLHFLSREGFESIVYNVL